MNIFIVGLGLIGGSLAEGLHLKGHHLYGYDQDDAVMKEAKEKKLIDQDSNIASLSEAELVILALYPKDNVSFMKQYGHHLKQEEKFLVLITEVAIFLLMRT